MSSIGAVVIIFLAVAAALAAALEPMTEIVMAIILYLKKLLQGPIRTEPQSPGSPQNKLKSAKK